MNIYGIRLLCYKQGSGTYTATMWVVVPVGILSQPGEFPSPGEKPQGTDHEVHLNTHMWPVKHDRRPTYYIYPIILASFPEQSTRWRNTEMYILPVGKIKNLFALCCCANTAARYLFDAHAHLIQWCCLSPNQPLWEARILHSSCHIHCLPERQCHIPA